MFGIATKGLQHGALGLGLLGLLVMPAAGCGSLYVKRDLSRISPGVVSYDDMCGLQDYFDGMKDSTIATPREVFGQDLSADESGQKTGGRARFRYETEFQLHHLRKLLAANWGSIPDEAAKADALELEVRWSKRAGVKRLVTEEPAQLSTGNKSWELPYQVCLSDFVYGEDLYNTRRVVLQLPAPPRSPFSKRPTDKPAAVALTAAPGTSPAGGSPIVSTPIAAPGTAPALVPGAALAPAPVSLTPPAASTEPEAPPVVPAAAPTNH
jgi:hypothetical protein